MSVLTHDTKRPECIYAIKTPKGHRPIEILLVEDNWADVMLTRGALSDSRISHELQVVRDGEKALAFLRRQGEFSGEKRPDIVLLDLNLPRVDGHQVLREMKADPDLQSIPVIVLSGSASSSDVQKSHDQHVATYLSKPARLNQYFAIIRAIEDVCQTLDHG